MLIIKCRTEYSKSDNQPTEVFDIEIGKSAMEFLVIFIQNLM